MAQNLDWVAVMTYDFHGQWDKQTGHVAPMYLHDEDSVAFFNAVSLDKFEGRLSHFLSTALDDQSNQMKGLSFLYILI